MIDDDIYLQTHFFMVQVKNTRLWQGKVDHGIQMISIFFPIGFRFSAVQRTQEIYGVCVYIIYKYLYI